MQSKLERHTSIFILRIWQEYQTRQPPSLRGEIKDLSGRTQCAFSSIKELMDFLQSQYLEGPYEEA